MVCAYNHHPEANRIKFLWFIARLRGLDLCMFVRPIANVLIYKDLLRFAGNSKWHPPCFSRERVRFVDFFRIGIRLHSKAIFLAKEPLIL
jgi:hypothetical protein